MGRQRKLMSSRLPGLEPRLLKLQLLIQLTLLGTEGVLRQRRRTRHVAHRRRELTPNRTILLRERVPVARKV
jgi:hypothetical protein